MQNLNATTAYKAMARFLERYYALTSADEIGALLGSMNMGLFQDEKPADPAMWDEWMNAIREVMAEQTHQSDK